MIPTTDNHPFNNTAFIEQALKEFKNINWEGNVLQDIMNEYLKD